MKLLRIDPDIALGNNSRHRRLYFVWATFASPNCAFELIQFVLFMKAVYMEKR